MNSPYGKVAASVVGVTSYLAAAAAAVSMLPSQPDYYTAAASAPTERLDSSAEWQAWGEQATRLAGRSVRFMNDSEGFRRLSADIFDAINADYRNWPALLHQKTPGQPVLDADNAAAATKADCSTVGMPRDGKSFVDIDKKRFIAASGLCLERLAALEARKLLPEPGPSDLRALAAKRNVLVAAAATVGN